MICFQCRRFYTEVCNRSHFPSDPACDLFCAIEDFIGRKTNAFTKLAVRLSGMSDAELVAEVKIKCKNTIRNTPTGQYIAEMVRRLEKNSTNRTEMK